MVFSSAVFLFIFLPVVWLLHAVIPAEYIRLRNVLLGIASVVFYAYGEPVYILLMIGSVLLNYAAARLIDRAAESGQYGTKTALTVGAVVVNLGILAFFKYIPWLLSLTVGENPLAALSLPVGISFYTFQILSYVIDVSRGRARVQKNFFNLFLYISFFPQLIAGPIVTYDQMESQLTERRMTLDGTADGIRRFIFGLSKKLLVANTAAVLADAAFAADSPSSLFAWCGAAAYCLQIYFDFSGYSDMAIGLAALFGFRIGENFRYPYAAVTIRDFWKRWHISLTSWFREYVYIPLGGNRGSPARTVLNRYIVFFLTGLWHGANFTYIVWGLWHGTLMMFERVVHLEKLAEKKLLRPLLRIYTLLCVLVGFVVFRADRLTAAFSYLDAMFSFGGSPADVMRYLDPWTLLLLGVGVVLSAPLLRWIRQKATDGGWAHGWRIAEFALSVPLFALCVMTLASSTFNPFIYYIF